MPKVARHRTVISENALGWTTVLAVLIAAIILDQGTNKWHPAIWWTAATFYGVLIFCRRKWRSWQFWGFWATCLVLHMFVMWVIYGKLWPHWILILPRSLLGPRLILTQLFVAPLAKLIELIFRSGMALIESIFLTVMFLRLERFLHRDSSPVRHLKA
jgi:hypothetical protein